jgi:hypothetical protein
MIGKLKIGLFVEIFNVVVVAALSLAVFDANAAIPGMKYSLLNF